MAKVDDVVESIEETKDQIEETGKEIEKVLEATGKDVSQNVEQLNTILDVYQPIVEKLYLLTVATELIQLHLNIKCTETILV